MIEPFEPSNLHPRASLNRMRVIGGAASGVPADVQGKTGIELVSARAWSAMIRERAASLSLSADEIALSDRELPMRFDRCFDSGDEQVRAAAEQLARQFARNMGCILLALKRPDAVTYTARPDWDETWWNASQRVESIAFGGGLLSGNVGKRFAGNLSAFLREHPLDLALLQVEQRADALPMIGAARTAPADARLAIVLDFGCTNVKRGTARYADQRLVQFQPAAPIPARIDGSPLEVFSFMVETIVATWNELAHRAHEQLPVARTIPVSVAAYLRKGQPYDEQGGGYAGIRHIAPNAAAALSDAVSARLGFTINVRLLHDGTAAAMVLAENENAAMIVLGTAMGIGFPPPPDGLWKL